METKNVWNQYYQQALSRAHNTRTEYAVKLNQTGLNVAVDCGCGTGSDIDYLLKVGYTVYGFDSNPQAIEICNKRFEDQERVYLTESAFENFSYPKMGLLMANNSLYFADPKCWDNTWQRMCDALLPKGVLVANFMGPKDSWANQYRSATLPLEQDQLEAMLADFDIFQLNERDEIGTTAIGKEKHWHTYSVVAIKKEY